MSEWTRTDDYQLVHKIDEDNFIVLDTTFLPDDTAKVFRFYINIQDHLDKAGHYIKSHGYSRLEESQEAYGDNWKQVFAEYVVDIISSTDELFVGSTDEAYEWLDCLCESKRDIDKLDGYLVR